MATAGRLFSGTMNSLLALVVQQPRCAYIFGKEDFCAEMLAVIKHNKQARISFLIVNILGGFLVLMMQK